MIEWEKPSAESRIYKEKDLYYGKICTEENRRNAFDSLLCHGLIIYDRAPDADEYFRKSRNPKAIQDKLNARIWTNRFQFSWCIS